MRQRHISGLFPEETPTHQTGAWPAHLQHKDTQTVTAEWTKDTVCGGIGKDKGADFFDYSTLCFTTFLCRTEHVFEDARRLQTPCTFESPCSVLQLQSSVMQQLPASHQVLSGKHLAALHPHDGLTVSATGDDRKQRHVYFSTSH